jgi:hypothetical protein
MKFQEEWKTVTPGAYSTGDVLKYEDKVYSDGYYDPVLGEYTYPKTGSCLIISNNLVDDIGGATYAYLVAERNGSIDKNGPYCTLTAVALLPTHACFSIKGNRGDKLKVILYHNKGSAVQLSGAPFNNISFTME